MAPEQPVERTTIRSVKIDDEVVALSVAKRSEKRFVFEIMRDGRLVAAGEEHKTADRAAKSGKSIWRRIAKTVLVEKLST